MVNRWAWHMNGREKVGGVLSFDEIAGVAGGAVLARGSRGGVVSQ